MDVFFIRRGKVTPSAMGANAGDRLIRSMSMLGTPPKEPHSEGYVSNNFVSNNFAVAVQTISSIR
ncbi:MAG: hypothetical protein LW870_14980 [Pirellula sp.]|jgi:hypothetical protein|nr:hypothetical protein [Pirellula sp.]